MQLLPAQGSWLQHGNVCRFRAKIQVSYWKRMDSAFRHWKIQRSKHGQKENERFLNYTNKSKITSASMKYIFYFCLFKYSLQCSSSDTVDDDISHKAVAMDRRKLVLFSTTTSTTTSSTTSTTELTTTTEESITTTTIMINLTSTIDSELSTEITSSGTTISETITNTDEIGELITSTVTDVIEDTTTTTKEFTEDD